MGCKRNCKKSSFYLPRSPSLLLQLRSYMTSQRLHAKSSYGLLIPKVFNPVSFPRSRISYLFLSQPTKPLASPDLLASSLPYNLNAPAFLCVCLQPALHMFMFDKISIPSFLSILAGGWSDSWNDIDMVSTCSFFFSFLSSICLLQPQFPKTREQRFS